MKMKMKMRTDKNYYSVDFKYPEDDGTYFSLQTRFDTRDEAIKYALTIALNYIRELDLLVGWRVRYYFRDAGGEWSSMIVVKSTDSVDWSVFSKDNKKCMR